MFIVDSHCDSIQKVDHCQFGIVNPHNYSTKYQQIQFVAMMTGWPGDTVKDAWRRACRYTGLFCMAMESEKDKVIQIKSYADIERAFAEGKHGALLTIESATGIQSSPKLLRDFYNVGVRVVGLTWLTNDMGKSNRVVETDEEDTGLTDAGKNAGVVIIPKTIDGKNVLAISSLSGAKSVVIADLGTSININNGAFAGVSNVFIAADANKLSVAQSGLLDGASSVKIYISADELTNFKSHYNWGAYADSLTKF